MVERAHEKYRDGGEPDAVFARGHVRRDRHLANVPLETAHHAAKRVDEDRDLFERERKPWRLDDTLFEGLIVPLQAGNGSEREIGHGRRIPWKKLRSPHFIR